MLSGPDSLAVCDLFPRCRNRIEHTPLHVVDCCWLALLRGSDVENNTVSSVLLPITCLAMHRHHVQQSKQEDQLLHSHYSPSQILLCPILYGESQAQLFSCSRLGCLSVDCKSIPWGILWGPKPKRWDNVYYASLILDLSRLFVMLILSVLKLYR